MIGHIKQTNRYYYFMYIDIVYLGKVENTWRRLRIYLEKVMDISGES